MLKCFLTRLLDWLLLFPTGRDLVPDVAAGIALYEIRRAGIGQQGSGSQ